MKGNVYIDYKFPEEVPINSRYKHKHCIYTIDTLQEMSFIPLAETKRQIKRVQYVPCRRVQ